jgi:hypothetical protein
MRLLHTTDNPRHSSMQYSWHGFPRVKQSNAKNEIESQGSDQEACFLFQQRGF